MVIRILDVTTSADTGDQGEKAFKRIHGALSDRRAKVIVSFDGVKTATSSFVNVAFVQLLSSYSFQDIKSRLRVVEFDTTDQRHDSVVHGARGGLRSLGASGLRASAGARRGGGAFPLDRDGRWERAMLTPSPTAGIRQASVAESSVALPPVRRPGAQPCQPPYPTRTIGTTERQSCACCPRQWPTSKRARSCFGWPTTTISWLIGPLACRWLSSTGGICFAEA